MMSVKWMTGLCFIVIVCFLWTGASYLTQFIYADLSFQSPFLFTYLSSSFFALYLPFWQLCIRMGWVIDPPSQHGIKRRNRNKNKSYMELQQEQDASDHGQDNQQPTVEMTILTRTDHNNIKSVDQIDSVAASSPIPLSPASATTSSPPRTRLIITFVSMVMEAVKSLSLRPIDTTHSLPLPPSPSFSPLQPYIVTTSPIIPLCTVTSIESGDEHNNTFLNGSVTIDASPSTSISPTPGTTSSPSTLPLQNLSDKETIPKASHIEGFTHSDMLSAAILLSPLWFLANCMYNYALLYTSVESSTVISNLSGGFTLLFSWLCGIEKITFGKVCGLMLCFVGVVLVTVHDTESPSDAMNIQQDASVSMDGGSGSGGTSGGNVASSIWYGEDHGLVGDVMAVIGAVGYGLYTTAMRLKITDDESASMQLLLGYLGLVNAISLFPMLIFMVVMNLGNVRQLTLTAFLFCFISGFFDDVISDYLWGRSVLLTSPTVATVGLTLTIPMAIVVDLIAGNNNSISSPLPLVGAALVVVGFIVVNVGCETCCEVICNGRNVTEKKKQEEEENEDEEELEFQLEHDNKTTVREDDGRK